MVQIQGASASLGRRPSQPQTAGDGGGGEEAIQRSMKNHPGKMDRTRNAQAGVTGSSPSAQVRVAQRWRAAGRGIWRGRRRCGGRG